MKKTIHLLLVAGLLAGILTTAYAGENKKLAQSGFQFLSVISDARAAAMADAMTSLEIGSSALFFNPAGMASMEGFVDMTASLNYWIADISHNAFSLAVSPAGGRYGVFGLSFQNVDYGDFYGTRVDKSTDVGYVDTDVFKLSSMAVGVGYAKRLNDRFSVGNELTPLAFDFGTRFKTGFKSLVFGMSVRNFSKEIQYVEEGFQLPLVFNLGISMNVMDFWENAPLKQSLVVSIDASHYRSHPEQLKFGLDYCLMDILSVRGGYVTNNDEDGFSFGVGVSWFGVTFDYAYSPFGIFDKVQRMTARFSM